MKTTRKTLALALMVAPTVGLGHARPQAEIERLGVLPGTISSNAAAISGDGKVIYGTSFLPGSVRGFRWTESGGMQELAHQGQPLHAFDTNFDGSVFVGGLPTTHTPDRATAGGAVLDLGLLPTWVAASARAVSADGSVVVGEAELPLAPWFTTRAFRWTAATGLVELPVPSGGALLMGAEYVSADGAVIVGRVDTGVRNRAFVWRATTGTQLLPTLPNADLPSQVTGLSADGRYAIGHVAGSVQGVPDRAVRWDLTTGTLSFVFGPQETDRRLYGINRDGSVLVGTVNQLGFGLSAQTGEVVLADMGTLTSSAGAINDDGTVIVGSNRMQGATSSIAFRYEFPGLGTPYCPGVPNSTGEAAATLATGSSDAGENRVTLFAQGLPNQSFGYFLTSANQGAIANPGGSQGTLCLQGSIGRFVGPGQIQSSGSTGRFELTLDLTQHPTPAGFVSVQSGQTWNFTAWYRDFVAGSPTSNFSSGLEVRFR